MAKTSGSSGAPKMRENDSSYRGSIKNVESLANMVNPTMYKATKEAISRFHAVLGVRERNVKLAEMSKRVYGVHSNNGGVYLNSRYFKEASAADMAKRFKEEYKSGWQTETNKPVAHVVTHELAHATWNARMTTANAIAAGKEIRALRRKWTEDMNKSGYGRYAETNTSEFWAELCTKAVHGKQDKYTKAAKAIVKKYKL